MYIGVIVGGTRGKLTVNNVVRRIVRIGGRIGSIRQLVLYTRERGVLYTRERGRRGEIRENRIIVRAPLGESE